ncbi:hypothetical protein GS979_07490 [Rhodococcus hoagii]|nr:hypothetical protein [Prescottella equi]
MLVAKLGNLEPTEQQLAAALEQLDASLVGCAVFNIWVPPKTGGWRQVDAIIWTPQRCIVVEVKGFTTMQSGALTASANGSWRIDGARAALHSQGTDDEQGIVNPFQQVLARAFDLKNHLSRNGFDGPFVDAMVVLYPQPGCAITMDTVSPPYGARLLVADPSNTNALHGHLAAISRGKVRWTANDIVKALASLNLPDEISTDDLTAAGFPEHNPQGTTATAQLVGTHPTATIAAIPPDVSPRIPPQTVSSPTPAALHPTAPITASTVGAAPTPVPVTRRHTPEAESAATWSTPLAAQPPVPVHNSPNPSTPLPRMPRTPTRSRPIRRKRSFRRAGPTVAAIALLGSVFTVVLTLAPNILDNFASADDPVTPVSFTTPSQNIACTIGTDPAGDFVRCDVAEYTYLTPPPEIGCAPQDWGHTSLIRRGSDANFACATDFLIGRGFPQQGYGTTVTAGRFSCSVTEDAVTCKERGGASFRVSRHQAQHTPRP